MLMFCYFRPQFELIEEWLSAILLNVSMDRSVPSDLLFDIQNFKGNQSYDSSLCTTPDGKFTSEFHSMIEFCQFLF